ncbi:cupin domain-containing protein [Thermococcus waiotapuensis]|uniref:Cupin domain-containing protein n=1 Tax=Thermococcus waiotapuensis TaxID=90909 RepID=A0AAE4NVY9_9EURY|nr:cupin domain-containing protein [Thermococcus waiotapuensis]MDV3104291.1 cupin domain-containing protein [Thermococcus waiotapuensis]
MKAEIRNLIDRGTYRKLPLFEGELPKGSYAQIVEIKPNQTVKRHYHGRQYELFYIISGEARLGIGETEYLAKPGDIFLVKPKTVHWVVNEKDEPFRLFVVKLNYYGDDSVWLDG